MIDSIFRSVIYDLQNRKQYNLAWQLQRDLFLDELRQKEEKEQLKKEIADDVMSRITVQLDKTAIDELSKAIDNLGK